MMVVFGMSSTHPPMTNSQQSLVILGHSECWLVPTILSYCYLPHTIYLTLLFTSYYLPHTIYLMLFTSPAIYLTLQNMPHRERFKEENIILVGVILGPSEPNLVINSYLSPLVEELEFSWYNGFTVLMPESVVVTVRVGLSCVACDIPASRKVNGFLGHHTCLACNKCLEEFSVSFGTPTNCGLKRSEWFWGLLQIITNAWCKEIVKETTEAAVKRLESNYGIYYSVLLSSSYFDPVRCTAIDPMHNLFLGTGKHTFKVWLANGILSEHYSLVEIDHRAKLVQFPSDVGRLPTNISSNYGGFKADQWRAWITVYSPVVLKGLLLSAHFLCWMIFVMQDLRCCILCQRILKKADLVTADLLLLNFCK